MESNKEKINVKPGKSPIAAIAESMLQKMIETRRSELTASFEIGNEYLLTLSFKFEDINENDI